MPEPEQTDLPEATPSPEGEQPSENPDAFHVLVVDDEDDVRDVLYELIRLNGYRVTSVPGGREALDVLGETTVDLILTDLMMPEMNGWQLLRAVKAEYSHIPVVVITGYISEQAETILTSSQAEAYLTKPVNHQRLQTLLKALLFPQNLGRPAEVLVVDDDKSIRVAIDRTLSKRGLYVHTFEDPSEALRQIREKPPELFIVDLMLAGTDGFDFCRTLRSDPDTAQIPILILTAHPSRENVMKAMQLRIDGFIAKPFSPEELAERVLRTIRQAGGGA